MTPKTLPFVKFVRRNRPPYNREERIKRQLDRRLKYLRQAGRYYDAAKEERTA